MISIESHHKKKFYAGDIFLEDPMTNLTSKDPEWGLDVLGLVCP